MAGRDDVTLSFYGSGTNQRKAPMQQPHQGFPMRPPLIPMQSQPAGLPFMSFDIGSTAAPPPATVSGSTYSSGSFGNFEDEAPLLEELGINPSQILQKTLSVLNPFRSSADLHEDADLSGPFLFCMLFGLCQLLAGKLHFGVILGWGSIASSFLYVITNLLSGSNGTLDLYRSFSLVGYSLIPMIVLSALSIFIPYQGTPIYVMAAITIVWCTWSCTSLLVVLAPHAEEHKRLVAYACCIIFLAFALLVVF